MRAHPTTKKYGGHQQFFFPSFASPTRSTLSSHPTLAINSLLIPSNKATLRLEGSPAHLSKPTPTLRTALQSFLAFGWSPASMAGQGRIRFWYSGKSYLVNALCKKYGVQYTAPITIGNLAVMYPGDLLKGLKSYLASIEPHASAVVDAREDSDFACARVSSLDTRPCQSAQLFQTGRHKHHSLP
ncbi:MAG: hypothetical protein J3Q66DRAFT_186665 [Benniella sp.]|nr:MAG: hypothetical protein J3Q66DRAFT_186665 [Benniella sp.]